MKKFLMAALAVTALTTSLYASAAEAGTGTGGAVIGIPANVVTIGPCKLFDTDGGDVPGTGGYVAGLCDQSVYRIDYYSAESMSLNGQMYTAFGGNPRFGRVDSSFASFPSSPFTPSYSEGAISSNNETGQMFTVSNNASYFFGVAARDTQIKNDIMTPTKVGELEYIVGNKAGFAPIIKVWTTTSKLPYTILSARIRQCSSWAFQAVPQNISANIFGINLPAFIKHDFIDIPSFFENTFYPGAVNYPHVFACTPVVVQTGTSTK